MRLFTRTFFILFSTLAAISNVQAQQTPLFQYNSVNALLDGMYDGDYSIQQLAQHGDFALGAMNGLDGEMIGLEGIFYRYTREGAPQQVDKNSKVPFATIVTFTAAATYVEKQMDNAKFNQFLTQKILEKNTPHAIKIHGEFSSIIVRTYVKQEKPYQPILQAIKQQQEFQLENIKGTLVGFWYPEFLEHLNVPGFHFHFISDDKQFGGHVLDVNFTAGDIAIQRFKAFNVLLPSEALFDTLPLAEDHKHEMTEAYHSSQLRH